MKSSGAAGSNNQDSIYYYKPGQFKEYVRIIVDKSMLVSDALGTFRELKCLPARMKQRTVQELSASPQLIQGLYNALRNGMRPQSRFKLPYDKGEREKELIGNIAETYDIDTKKAKCKIVTGHYDDGVQVFNYALEIVVAPRKDIGVESAGEVEIIGNVNGTPSIDGGEGYFQGGEYRWTDKKGNMMYESSIRGILHECGFNSSMYVNASKKKVPSVVYLNLMTPCPDWLGSAGKTHIDVRPYAQDITKTVSSLAYKIPSYHGKGYGCQLTPCYGEGDYSSTAQQYLEDFLRERYDAIQVDPFLKSSDRITQSGVWYRIRPIMIKDGFQPRKDWGTTRKTVTGSINKVCLELFGEDMRREELGIIASARAVMYYNGSSYPVSIDNLEALAGKGIAIIIIEKEGIADILNNYADKYGVALMHTKGRFTEYGKDLIEAAKESGSVVGILVDYDAYGAEIVKSSRTETPRIGIDRETITWLRQNGYPTLTEADVEEDYTPDIWTNDNYLRHHRIELDSVAAKVGAQGLWKYIMYRLHLKEFAPEGFDLNRVITKPENEILYPEAVSNFLSYLNSYVFKLSEDKKQQIEESLTNVTELTELKKKNKEIKETLARTVAEDEGMQLIVSKLEDLHRALPEMLEKRV
jgi:hypothetical protein